MALDPFELRERWGADGGAMIAYRAGCRLTAYELSGATRPGRPAEPMMIDARREAVSELTRVASAAARG